MKESELRFFNVFSRFIKEKKIYKNFIRNYEKSKPSNSIEHRFHLPYFFLSSSFIWDDTDEGGKIWCDLDSDWKHINDNFWGDIGECERKMVCALGNMHKNN